MSKKNNFLHQNFSKKSKNVLDLWCCVTFNLHFSILQNIQNFYDNFLFIYFLFYF